MQASERGGYLLYCASLLNARLFNRFLAEDGRALYSAEQGKILSCLWEQTPLTATDISIRTGLANNTLSAMLRRLEQQGLINSQPHPDDRRKRFFDLTDLGRAQEAVGQEVSQRLSAVFYRDFSPADRAQFEACLAKILSNLQAEEKRWKQPLTLPPAGRILQANQKGDDTVDQIS